MGHYVQRVPTMATIEKRTAKDGTDSYRVRIRLIGEKPRTRTFARKTDAKAWASSVETDLSRGAFVPTTTDRRRTLDMLIDKYVTEYLPHKPNNADAAKQIRLLDWWKADSGFVTLDKLKPETITDARARLRARIKRNGAPLSVATVNRHLAALSAVCKWGWKELRWLPSNPLLSITKGSEGSGTGRALEPQEQAELLRACRESADPNLHCFVILALTTANRYTPIRMLRWDDVDFERKSIDFGIQKNGRHRIVPIVGPAGDALRAQLERDPTKTGWVFKGRSDAMPADLDKAFRKIRTELGLVGERNFRIHDLRHTAASYLAMNGANEAELMAAVGWLTPSMAKRYTHVYADHTRDTLERMAARFLPPTDSGDAG
jgi:integrase